MIVAVAAPIVAAATALSSNGDAQSASRAPGAILFARETAGGYENFFWMDADGSNQRRLPSPGRVHAAVWSPNGRRIALATGSYPRVVLHVADADGANRRALTRRFRADSITPVWSPNSRRIAFELYDDGCHSLYVVNAGGGPLKRLTKKRGCADDQDPAWSPDGKRIVFTSSRRLVVIGADGRHRRLLTRASRVMPHENFDDKFWLPGVILFINPTSPANSDEDPEWHVVSVKPDGSGLKDLTPDVSAVRAFEVAPDRKTIAYEAHNDIFLVDVAGSNARRWARDARGPTWAPDTRSIAFAGGRGDSIDIYVMNVDGSGSRNLTRSAATECCAAWRPGGR